MKSGSPIEGDRSGVVEEGVAVADLGGEAEVVDDVIARIADVVDDDQVARRGIPGKEVWPAGGLEQGSQLLISVTVFGLSGLTNA